MAKILVVYHSQTGNTEKLAQSVAKGAQETGAAVTVKKASEATVDDFLNCDAIAFGSPNYFSYMAGMVKDFFDRAYHSAINKVANKPYVVFATHGGGGGTPVIASLERLCQSFKLKRVGEPLSVNSEPQAEDLKQGEELGKRLASQVK